MRYRIIAILIAAMLLVSCSSKYRYKSELAELPSAWPHYRGNLEAQGNWPGSEYTGRLDLLWSDKIGYRPAAPLTIYHGQLVLTTTGKKIRFYDLSKGSLYGQVRLSGTGQTAIVMDDSLLYVGLSPNRNRVEALNLANRKVIWRVPVKDAAPAPIILNDRLIISSSEGTVSALSLMTGSRLWDFSGSGRFVAGAAFSDGKIFQPSDNGHLFAIADSTGELSYEVKLDGPLVGGVAVAGLVYVASMSGCVYGIQASDGAVLWQTRLAGPIWTVPAISDGLIVIGHSGGEVVALSRNNGSLVWKHQVVDVIKASPLLVGQHVVVGTMSGKLMVLRLQDGSLESETEVTGAIAFPPVTDGTRIYVATQSGRILCYGDEHAQLTEDRF